MGDRWIITHRRFKEHKNLSDALLEKQRLREKHKDDEVKKTFFLYRIHHTVRAKITDLPAVLPSAKK